MSLLLAILLLLFERDLDFDFSPELEGVIAFILLIFIPLFIFYIDFAFFLFNNFWFVLFERSFFSVDFLSGVF